MSCESLLEVWYEIPWHPDVSCIGYDFLWKEKIIMKEKDKPFDLSAIASHQICVFLVYKLYKYCLQGSLVPHLKTFRCSPFSPVITALTSENL